MKKNFLLTPILFVSLLYFTGIKPGFAQVTLPPASPKATLTQHVGLTRVSVTYSRPSVQGRKIFGELVPYGKVWRTGANESTKIRFAEPVTIEGHKIPGGTFALYTVPGNDQWTIIIHKDTTHWGSDNYNQTADYVRFNVPSDKLQNNVEAFTIDFTNYTQNSADIELMWAKTVVKFRIETEVDSRVMAQLQAAIKANPDNDYSVYYLAAGYLYNQDKDLDQALNYISKSIFISPKYWTTHLKAKILAKQKKYQAAIQAANDSIALARKARNQDYVKLNQRYIDQWKKLTKGKQA